MEPIRKVKQYSRGPLARLRKARKMTQQALAEKIGFKHKNTLCQIECGERMASPKNMAALALALEVSKRDVLEACTACFEQGRLMRRHRIRQLKLTAGTEK